VCGEKVEVTPFVSGKDQINDYPAAATVSCRQGHVATFTADQYAALEHWDEPEDD
jgi:hypothetical protein